MTIRLLIDNAGVQSTIEGEIELTPNELRTLGKLLIAGGVTRPMTPRELDRFSTAAVDAILGSEGAN